MQSKLEPRVRELGNQLFELSSKSSMSLFDKGFWSGKMMDWSMNNHDFKVQMFRFVDVLPSLKQSEQVSKHVKEYFLDDEAKIPTSMKAAMGVASTGGIIGKMASSTIRKNVESMAEMFIAGKDSKEALPSLEKHWKQGLAFTVDILGEAVVSDEEALDYQSRYLELVTGIADVVKAWPFNDVLENAGNLKLPRANVSVKCSSLYSEVSSYAFRDSVDAIKSRIRPILEAAMQRNVCINLDMEQVDYKDIILTVAEELFSEDEFKNYPYFGLVLQCYLKSAPQDCERVVKFAKRRKVPLTVRLVKGAYWDFEVIRAKENNWEIPVFTQKAQSDACFEECTEIMLRSFPHIYTALGSHNVRNIAFGMSLAEELKIPKQALEIQMLFGMADPFKKAVSDMGYRLREYVPIGEMLPGMAYLVRRLLENTSNEGFLRAKFVKKEDQGALLDDPAKKVLLNLEPSKGDMIFKNEAPIDFASLDAREKLEKALMAAKKRFPIVAHPIVGGKRIEGLSLGEHFAPTEQKRVVSNYALSTVEIAENAVESAASYFETWNEKFPVFERIKLVRNLAQKMRDKRFELMAIMMDEVSKIGPEADGDVCEAIDFCEFYADSMEKLATPQERGFLPGEANKYMYKGKGVALVIAPWNFPLAILCGMTVAPLLAGNTVIMKPAEQSSGIATILYEMMMDVGFPKEAIQFLPGKGEVVGAHLVGHPKVNIINFTGSRDVGLKILKSAYDPSPKQKHIKRVVAELGGKNALIVDDDADLDEAILGTVKSAFHFQGQKCSALSRVLVHESCYDKFLSRLCQSLKSTHIGDVSIRANKIAAVIDREAQQRLLSVIERNKSKIAAQLEISDEMIEAGCFVPPTVFADEDFKSELSQTEHFGPLLVVHKFKTIEEAIADLNDSDYALTGGIFSRSPRNIELFRKKAEVGNLYINRGITGSIVSRQPFGGFKLSGVGAKAGGPDYLLQFLSGRTQTENLMRRGFTPEL